MQTFRADSLDYAKPRAGAGGHRLPPALSRKGHDSTAAGMPRTSHETVKESMIDNQNVGVLCVDDNPLVGEAIGITLRQEPGMAWLGQRLTADNLRQAVDDLRPAVVLLDLDMPGKNPFDALEEIGQDFPDVRVIVLTGHVRREYVDRAFERGAWGYLSKNEGASRIVSAIRRVLVDEIVMSPEVESVLGL